MCFDPISIGLMAAGTGAGMYGASKTRNEKILNDARQADARNAVLRDYLGRQKVLQDENQVTNTATIGKFDAPTQTAVLADAQGARANDADVALAPLNNANYAGIPLPGNSPSGVKSDIASRLRAGFDKATATAKASAKLGGYNALTTSDAGRKIDTVNSFARGNTSILPSLQDAAQYGAYEAPSGMGALFSSIGNLLAGAGGAGTFAPKKKAATTGAPLFAPDDR